MIIMGALSAAWLGILTSISPCPLATNIAAVSFIGKKVTDTRHVLISGLSYTFGRMLTYLILGMILVAGLLSVPGVANFLQEYMNIALGLILIIAGMFLLEMLQLNISGPSTGNLIARSAERGGVLTAALLGIVFALSFCPISAALFFGSLIPLAIQYESRFLLPALYGIGTALPVVVFAVLLASGAKSVGKVFDNLRKFERWARIVTGVIFILVGLYFTLHHIYGVI